jgi:hypothetical protein
MGMFSTTWSLQVEKILPPVLRDRDFQVNADDDFLTGDADNNYIEYILVSAPGHWKEFPVVGVAIWQYLQGTQSPQVLQRAIRVQLEADIFSKPQVDMRKFASEGLIYINRVEVNLNGQ